MTAPYRFSLAGLAVPGENTLRIEVESRPAYRKAEGLGSLLDGLTGNTYNAYRPCGLLGPVEAVFYQKPGTETK